MESIGENAFYDCAGIAKIVALPTTPPTMVDEYTFWNMGVAELTVPCGCGPAYENSLWNECFTTFLEDCNAVSEFEESFVSLYPNPTYGVIKIEAENIQNVSIYNVFGKLVFEKNVNGNSLNYDFGDNESGIYFIRIETQQGVETKKVTVK